MHSITIFDIAKEAGVSIATVSRVINNLPNVSEKTRTKILHIIKKYSYRPSQVATGLGAKQSLMLAAILPPIINPFYATLLTHMQEAAKTAEYMLAPYCSLTKGTPILQDMTDNLIKRRFDGVLISDDLMTDYSRQHSHSALEQLQKHMPVVVINSRKEDIEGFTNLSVDIKGAAEAMMRHLFSLGHERIAMIDSWEIDGPCGYRNKVYTRMMSEKGLEKHIRTIASGEDVQSGDIGVVQLLTNLPGNLRPTAIFAINDLVAMGAIYRLRLMGLRVPQDVAVVGFDNQFFSPYLSPSLTTVDFHEGDLARSALNLLIRARDNPIEPLYQLYPFDLIIRESCGHLSADYGVG